MGFKSDKVHESRRMWENGPLRQFSMTRPSAGWTPYDTGGYVGCYVCDECHKAVSGVYESGASRWVCADCRQRGKSIPLSGKAKGKTQVS